jgi:hypothetical protein
MDLKDMKEVVNKLKDDPSFQKFAEAAASLERRLMAVIADEPTQDLRVVVAALGPLVSQAVAHLTPIMGNDSREAKEQYIRQTFKQLGELSVEHLQTCKHMDSDEPPKDDPYAPPVTTH